MATTKVLDLTGRARKLQVRVESGPSFEFLVSLCAFGLPNDRETMEVGPAWFDKIRRLASPELLAAWDRTGLMAGKAWVNFVGLATATPAARDVPALLARIQSLSALDVRLYLLGYHVPAYQGKISRDLLRQAALGDPAAQDSLLTDSSYFGGEADPALRPLLALGVDETKAVALDVLHRWSDEVFARLEPGVAGALDRDAAATRKLAESAEPERLIELASGIQFVPNPAIRQVFLIPQVAMRPWVLLCEHDDARLFCYPVADESLGAAAADPPGRLVRLHKALGDQKRLRMLKAIATSTATLQELADLLGLPKSTAHHHLAILRAAGLVRVTSDLERRYSLRTDVIPEASSLLDAYLGGTP